MNRRGTAVFVDSEVPSQVLSIVDEANQYALLVTPYVKLWGHMKAAIERAVKRKVEVVLILRREEGVIGPEDLDWLIRNGVRVCDLERLHAKVYLNETRVLLSSMNITSSSAINSMEVAIEVTEPDAKKRVIDYVARSLAPIAQPVSKGASERSIPGEARAGSTRITAGLKTSIGSCIRCGRDLFLDPSKPLCDPCYASWAEWQNEDYPEHFCHSCGKEDHVTYARPLCRACYAAS